MLQVACLKSAVMITGNQACPHLDVGGLEVYHGSQLRPHGIQLREHDLLVGHPELGYGAIHGAFRVAADDRCCMAADARR